MPKFSEKSDIVKILANILWMLFDKVFMLLLGLLVTVEVANYYGVTEYGKYQYAISIVAIIEILVKFVDARTVKKQYVNADADVVVLCATVSRIIFSLLSFVVGLIYICIHGGDRQFNIIFVLLLLNAIVDSLKFGMANRFEFLLQAKRIVIATDISATVGTFLQLFIVKNEYPLTVLAAAALATTMINISIVYVQYRYQFKRVRTKRIKLDTKILKCMIKESLPLAIAGSCATIYAKCDSVMLGSMMTTAEVGIYALAAKMVSIVKIVVAPIRESIYPKLIVLYKTDRKAYERYYIKMTSIMTWIYIVGVSISYIIVPYVCKVLNDEYLAAIPVYRIYVLEVFFIYNAFLRAGHFTLVNKGSILMKSQIICVVVNIIMNFILIRCIGMYGAAIATVITQGISLMLSNVFFKEEGHEVLRWQLKALNPIRIFR